MLVPAKRRLPIQPGPARPPGTQGSHPDRTPIHLRRVRPPEDPSAPIGVDHGLTTRSLGGVRGSHAGVGAGRAEPPGSHQDHVRHQESDGRACAPGPRPRGGEGEQTPGKRWGGDLSDRGGTASGPRPERRAQVSASTRHADPRKTGEPHRDLDAGGEVESRGNGGHEVRRPPEGCCQESR